MDREKIMEGVRLILDGIGEDVTREGLLETPERVAKMYEELDIPTRQAYTWRNALMLRTMT